MASRFKELLKKYGKVALGVHFSVSAASITSLYIAIKNNVDIESILDKYHLPGLNTPLPEEQQQPPSSATVIQDGSVTEASSNTISADSGDQSTAAIEKKQRNRTAELAASSGGAFALAILCNKVLFPVRVPITIALTPPIARFLARRRMIKHGV